MQSIEGIHMGLGDKITEWLILSGGLLVFLGVIMKVILLLISMCGGFSG